jgi:hypothetical protein
VKIDLFYNLLHKRPMQYTNTARGNSGTLWVGGKSPGSGLPSYLFIICCIHTSDSITTVAGSNPTNFKRSVVMTDRLDKNSHQVVMYRLVFPIFKLR